MWCSGLVSTPFGILCKSFVHWLHWHHANCNIFPWSNIWTEKHRHHCTHQLWFNLHSHSQVNKTCDNNITRKSARYIRVSIVLQKNCAAKYKLYLAQGDNVKASMYSNRSCKMLLLIHQAKYGILSWVDLRIHWPLHSPVTILLYSVFTISGLDTESSLRKLCLHCVRVVHMFCTHKTCTGAINARAWIAGSRNMYFDEFILYKMQLPVLVI